MTVKHGVFIRYGVTEIELSKNELQLMADALDSINPDNDKQEKVARKLAASFLALGDYAGLVSRKKSSFVMPTEEELDEND